MTSTQSILVRGQNREWEIPLKEDKSKLTVGRDDGRDILLPDTSVSRLHCVLEKDEGNYWWVLDNTSTNGTFLKRGEKQIDIKRQGGKRLNHEDVILIPSKLEGQLTHWELVFHDFGAVTGKVPEAPILESTTPSLPLDRLEYSMSQQILFKVQGENRERIPLTGNERKMIRYMVQQNQKNDARSAMCDHKSLCLAIWEEADRNKNEVNRLVFGLRRKFELDPQNPIFLENSWGEGYLLKVILIK